MARRPPHRPKTDFRLESAGLFHEEKLKSVYRAFLRGLWKLYEFFITLDFFVL